MERGHRRIHTLGASSASSMNNLTVLQSMPPIHNRRQAHIASEQKRRQNINEGFEDLRRLVPACTSTTDSKAVILRKTVNYIVQLQGEVGKLRSMMASSPIMNDPGAAQHYPIPTKLRSPPPGPLYDGQPLKATEHMYREYSATSSPAVDAAVLQSSYQLGTRLPPSQLKSHLSPSNIAYRQHVQSRSIQLPPLQNMTLNKLPPMREITTMAGSSSFEPREDFAAASLSMLRHGTGRSDAMSRQVAEVEGKDA